MYFERIYENEKYSNKKRLNNVIKSLHAILFYEIKCIR